MSSTNMGRNLAMWVAFFLVPVKFLPVSVAECIGDFDCEETHFCYKQSGICIECVDCSRYNRMNSESQTCHRLPEDCGACVKGFKEEFLAHQAKRTACVNEVPGSVANTTIATTTITVSTTVVITETITSSSPILPEGLDSEFPNELISATAVVLFLCVVVFIVVFLYFIKLGRLKRTSIVASNDVESSAQCRQSTSLPLLSVQTGCVIDGKSAIVQESPPPYDESGPGKAVSVSPERVIILNIAEQNPKDVFLNNAMPWKDPEYCRFSSSESVESIDDSSEEPDYPVIHDEETTPSSWVPDPEQQVGHLQEASRLSPHAEEPEEDSQSSVPSVDLGHAQFQSQAALSPGVEASGGAVRELSVSLEMDTPSFSSQMDVDHPCRRPGGDADDVERPPPRKRVCQEDSLPLRSGPQVSATQLLDHGSCSSLFEDLTAIPFLSSAVSRSNIRHP